MDGADNLDRASELEEMHRVNAIRNALNGAAMNPMRGSNVCPNCKGRNDRAHQGFEWCSACAEDPDWIK